MKTAFQLLILCFSLTVFGNDFIQAPDINLKDGSSFVQDQLRSDLVFDPSLEVNTNVGNFKTVVFVYQLFVL